MGEQKTKRVSQEDALKEAEEMLKTLEAAKHKKSESKEEKPVEKKERVGKGEEKGEIGEVRDEAGEEKAKKREIKSGQLEDKSARSEKKSAKRGSADSGKSVKSVRLGEPRARRVKKIRGKKYLGKLALVDRVKQYSLAEAIELVKKTSYTKFDAAIELHIKLLPPKNKKNKTEVLRGMIQLPHPTGKEPKVGVIDEAMAEKIIKEKNSEFDILLARPDMMPKIAKTAKILGPQGKMPNPKTGTVTADPQKTMAEIKSGRREYKADDTGNIHLAIGKVSFNNNKLVENFNTLVNTIGPNKIQNITLSATMSPGVKVRL